MRWRPPRLRRCRVARGARCRARLARETRRRRAWLDFARTHAHAAYVLSVAPAAARGRPRVRPAHAELPARDAMVSELAHRRGWQRAPRRSSSVRDAPERPASRRSLTICATSQRMASTRRSRTTLSAVQTCHARGNVVRVEHHARPFARDRKGGERVRIALGERSRELVVSFARGSSRPAARQDDSGT